MLTDQLISRTRAELAAEFDLGQPYSVAQSHGWLDVMGGIAERTGSPIVRAPIEASAAVIVQARRGDRDVQIFSFDEFDAHRPFTLRMPVEALVEMDAAALATALLQPGRSWAGPVLEAIRSKHQRDLGGLNVAIANSLPTDRDLGATSALFSATRDAIGQQSGESSSVADIAFIDAAQQSAIRLPRGVRLIAIDSQAAMANDIGLSALMKLATEAHAAILETMREFGRRANRELVADPMRGKLSTLDPDDYKQFFRPTLSEPLQHAADHFVLEPRRVRDWVRSIERASHAEPKTRDAGRWLDRAGHLMYASDFSYRHDAKLSSRECEFLVDAAHGREKSGIYGARMSGNGAATGIVVVLADQSERVNAAMSEILSSYQAQFKRSATLIPLRAIDNSEESSG